MTIKTITDKLFKAKYAYYVEYKGTPSIYYSPLWLSIINNTLRVLQFYTINKWVVVTVYEMGYDAFGNPSEYKPVGSGIRRIEHSHYLSFPRKKSATPFTKIKVI